MPDNFDYKPRFGFDIRIKPDTEDKPRPEERICEWPSCKRPGTSRTAVAPNKPGKFWYLCPDHAREHNQSWDFFKDMSEEEAAEYRASMATGHRPTWKMGVNSTVESDAAEKVKKEFRPGFDHPAMRDFNGHVRDPYNLLRDKVSRTRENGTGGSAGPKRHLTKLQRGALDDLGLGETADMQDVRARYKELVKRFHPDSNGGDRGAEDSLRRVIRAYQLLKGSNFS